MNSRRFYYFDCEGCFKINSCFLLDPPYQRLVQDMTSKYCPDYCPCQMCIIKGMCNNNCETYSSALMKMYNYYERKWEEKETTHKREIERRMREVQRIFP